MLAVAAVSAALATSPVGQASAEAKAGPSARAGHAGTTANGVGTASARHTTTSATPGSAKIFFGVVGDQSQTDDNPNVGHHEYSQLNGYIPTGRMITMGTGGLTYQSISAAGPGSSAYTDLARWADTLKVRPGPILFAFMHEPEATYQSSFGDSASYIAAYRHIVDVFRSRGVGNVLYVWQMTDHSFALPINNPKSAANWYPGDNYVDAVGPDPYNWYNCGPGRGRWRDLSTIAGPALGFAIAHGKKLVLPEFGSQSGPQRAAWLATAHQWFVDNQANILAAFYFDRPATVAGNGCVWSLSSASDLNAITAIADDTTHFSS